MRHNLYEVRLRVPQKDIYYISWNMDACEGLGLLRTDDAQAGMVTVFTPEKQLRHLWAFIEGHRAEGIEIEIENSDGVRVV